MLFFKHMKSQPLSYTAVIQEDENGNHLVSFPALPGCVTFGRTYEEALKMGQEVLELWIEELVESGESLPEEGRSSFTTLKAPRPKARTRTRAYASTRIQKA